MKSVRLTVTGRVQGVGYRIWAERTAATLGLRGWVRNRTDGSVELRATGDNAAIAALIAACRQGRARRRHGCCSRGRRGDDGSAGVQREDDGLTLTPPTPACGSLTPPARGRGCRAPLAGARRVRVYPTSIGRAGSTAHSDIEAS